ncbi:tRNA (adenosine(37)-N6)-dimethylallyltransferase MiaA [Alicyclobacillus fastidiosus]|uniref:tRNA dimethylallyltransferase n=1 Tax=Alicyclobacillus fastidiosus TaxID=392011 RepID=A0ABY6ZD70_9BACL|nr:tRNA (adenosine(37)-N6)-dimethylallyltransferase MiaA [Alicyclobacillus fastidiosus]WAH40124.1 tRNA (adenosine(37)-N6)-dimethylallyltransferase MiaA [Alicyclobacillus fastidiosus]GMA61461.1 tRNA dimethylallyltransferase [Alicyclobacillus fastidiosus]
MSKQRVICVVGPTAVGKSDVAIDIALEYGGEVISADSMQVYRGMDIGTAKLSPAEQRGVAHHMLDVVEPMDLFTVATWKEAADDLIHEIAQRNRLPIVCGGTGLYIRSVTDDLTFGERPQASDIRTRWQAYVDAQGVEALHQALQEVDPASAARLHPNDVKRVIRALEVAETAPAPLSHDYDFTEKTGRYDVLLVGLWMERQALYRRVELRVDKMVEQGLEAEVKRLLAAGASAELPALQAIGYKEMVQYLRGDCTFDDAIDAIKRNTRRFVKRQLSWFRRDARIHWFERTADGAFADGEADRMWGTIRDFVEGKYHIRHE